MKISHFLLADSISKIISTRKVEKPRSRSDTRFTSFWYILAKNNEKYIKTKLFRYNWLSQVKFFSEKNEVCGVVRLSWGGRIQGRRAKRGIFLKERVVKKTKVAHFALLTPKGVGRQEQEKTGGDDSRPRESHGVLSLPELLSTFAQSSAVWHDVTRSTATDEHGKSVRDFFVRAFMLLWLPTRVTNLSYEYRSHSCNIYRERSAAPSTSGTIEIRIWNRVRTLVLFPSKKQKRNIETSENVVIKHFSPILSITTFQSVWQERAVRRIHAPEWTYPRRKDHSAIPNRNRTSFLR